MGTRKANIVLNKKHGLKRVFLEKSGILDRYVVDRFRKGRRMKLITHGKTKDVYSLDNGNVLLQFKDTVTGKDGVFDPGANEVGLSIEGMGHLGLRLTSYFFERLEKDGIPSHMVHVDLEKNTMEAKKAEFFGQGLEVICRFKAVGSFLRRYGKYVEEGQDLPGYVEITIKDDEAGDPLITKEGLLVLGILQEGEYEELIEKTRKISTIIKEILAEKDLDLYDIKLEFGRVGEDQQIVLIDEISGGNMRVYHKGQYVEPLELEKFILSK